MSDAVSKLYAEIGFKVNQDGLKQAQVLLKELAKQMSDINEATKEAARQYGIFSKDQNKQATADAKRAIDNEKAENQRNKRKLDNKKFEHKQLMDLAKLEFQVEKYNAAEKAQAERRQAREAEKAAKEQQKRLKNVLGGFRSFAVGLRNTFLALAGIGTGGLAFGIKQSLDRAVPTRNFLMTADVGLGELQQVMQRMVNTGSAMTQQQIMTDIQTVSQNLKDIALGGGGLVPYKLAGVAATGNVMDVIKNTEEAVKDLDNVTALNLTRRMGLSDDWLAMWRLREREGGDQLQITPEQQNEIIETEIALRQLKFAFKNLSDIATAALSPSIQHLADGLRDWFQSISRWIKEHPNTINDLLEDLHTLGQAIKFTIDMIVRAASWLMEKISGTAKDAKGLWEQSSIGRFIRSQQSGGMSKMNSAFEDELLRTYGGDVVNDFNNDRRTSSKYQSQIRNDDHSNTTINFNGYNDDQMVEKVENVMEQKEEKKNARISDRYKISDLWAVSPSAGGM